MIPDANIIEGLRSRGFNAEPRKYVWWVTRRSKRQRVTGFFFDRDSLQEHAEAGTIVEYVRTHLAGLR